MTDYYASIIVAFISILYGFFFGDYKERKNRMKLCMIVTASYMFSAYIISFSFLKGEYYLVSDPLKYINRFRWETLSYRASLEYLKNCYFHAADNNALYNVTLNWVAYFYKAYFSGVTAYSLALVQVLFGVLSSVTLFRILRRLLPEKKAFLCSLSFSLLSLFHFYSGVILRDVIIAFFYLLAFEIVLKEFSTKNLILLVVYMFITWGVRLYSGLFFVMFIFYYLYQRFYIHRARIILIPMLFTGVVLLAASSSFLIEQSIDEIQLYQTFTENRVEDSGGFFEKLLKLPFGIREIVLTLYSQVNPFPPFLQFRPAKIFSNYYMSTLVLVYEFWWFTISYTLMYLLFYKKTLKSLELKDIMLLLIALAFIVANTAQPDIRRMMPVYPIIYFYYLRLTTYTFKKTFVKKKRSELLTIYFLFVFMYILLK